MKRLKIAWEWLGHISTASWVYGLLISSGISGAARWIFPGLPGKLVLLLLLMALITVVLIAEQVQARARPDKLAEFVEQGQTLSRRCATEGDDAVQGDAGAWDARAAAFLRAKMGSSYAVLFRDGTGLTVYTGRKTQLQMNIEFRVQRLVQFIDGLHRDR